MYFKPHNGRWAPLGISKGTEATALSSKCKPTQLYLGHCNAVESINNEAFVR
jgi:hypothetical protein